MRTVKLCQKKQSGRDAFSQFGSGYFDGGGKANYYVTDWQGNVAMVIDSEGETAARNASTLSVSGQLLTLKQAIMKSLKVFLLHLLVVCTMLTSCSSNGKRSSGGHDDAVETVAADTVNVLNFMEALNLDRETCSDSLRVIKVVESKMYKEASSEMSEYVTLVNWLLDYCTEDAAEGIGLAIYRMFKAYPSKFDELESYMNLLPRDDKDKILRKLASIAAFELSCENMEKSIGEIMEIFNAQFPYLAKYRVCQEQFVQRLDDRIQDF